MKKVLLFIILISEINSGYTQTERSKMYIGGSLSLSSYNTSNSNSNGSQNSVATSFQFSPNIGYFIKENLAVGFNGTYLLNPGTTIETHPVGYSPSNMTTKSSINSYGGGCFARYYKRITPSMLIFINGLVSYGITKDKNEYSSTDSLWKFTATNPSKDESQYESYSLTFTPGITYFVSPHFGIEGSFGSMGYNYSISKSITFPNDNNRSQSSFIFNFRTSFSLALNYYF